MKKGQEPSVLCLATTVIAPVESKVKIKVNIKGDELTKLSLINRTNTDDQKDYEVYRFQDSGIGESWMLGNDNTLDYGNAFIGGYKKCPVDIIVPRSLTNKEGETKIVEVISKSAYGTCGNPNYGDKTKTVLVTKQVKIIKKSGFGDMRNVESFRIEEGSVLQSIETMGLSGIGSYVGVDDPKKRGTLILPSTLSSVAEDGIYNCNLFKVIIYCGTHSLSNTCKLYSGSGVEETKVRVTNQYSGTIIFGKPPLKDSPTEVEGNCSRMILKPTPKPTPSSSRSVSRSRSVSPSPSPFPTPTSSYNCPRSPLKQPTVHLAAIFFGFLPSHTFSSSSFSSYSTSINLSPFPDLFKFTHPFPFSVALYFYFT